MGESFSIPPGPGYPSRQLGDPLQVINLIANNLYDRYKSGIPVFKGIIQGSKGLN